MATQTANLGLTLPIGSEKVKRQVINSNNEIIDAAVGKIEDGIAYRLGETNTTGATLAVGTYVYVSGNSTLAEGLYTVSTAIGTGITLSSSNCTAVSGGGLNALNSKITPMGTAVTIETNITSDKTITHDFTQYRYLIIYYYTGSMYRQSAIYPKNMVTGSGKWGLDNLASGTDRCYILKTSGASNSSIDVIVSIPSSGTWTNGMFELVGIK